MAPKIRCAPPAARAAPPVARLKSRRKFARRRRTRHRRRAAWAQASCKACPTKLTTQGVGSASSNACVPCGVGKISDDKGGCSPCPRGTFAATPGQETCTECSTVQGAAETCTEDFGSTSADACTMKRIDGYCTPQCPWNGNNPPTNRAITRLYSGEGFNEGQTYPGGAEKWLQPSPSGQTFYSMGWHGDQGKALDRIHQWDSLGYSFYYQA